MGAIRPMLSRTGSFWLLGGLLSAFLFAASAPSPLYAVYQAQWHFSPLTLTTIYAVYAFGALTALLTTGRLSDHVGRRPVAALALMLQMCGMAAFIVAQDVEALFVGRIVQGVATGMGAGAISAWLIDLEPERRLASLVGGVAPVAGLAAGAVGAGLLVEYGPDPLHLVFWLLLAVYAVGMLAVAAMPDPVPRSAGWLRSMRPDVDVPAAARPLFRSLAPSLLAQWAIAGFYLSLGPSLALALLVTANRAAGGLVIGALLGTGAVASAVVRAADPRAAAAMGSTLLAGGVALTLAGVATGSAAVLFGGSIVAGLGLGPAFSGVFRMLVSVAPAERRGALVAAIYVGIYLSFSIPAIIAGLAVTRFGLRETAFGYGTVVIALAAITAVQVRRPRRPVRSQ
jgi:MFS family permease